MFSQVILMILTLELLLAIIVVVVDIKLRAAVNYTTLLKKKRQKII